MKKILSIFLCTTLLASQCAVFAQQIPWETAWQDNTRVATPEVLDIVKYGAGVSSAVGIRAMLKKDFLLIRQKTGIEPETLGASAALLEAASRAVAAGTVQVEQKTSVSDGKISKIKPSVVKTVPQNAVYFPRLVLMWQENTGAELYAVTDKGMASFLENLKVKGSLAPYHPRLMDRVSNIIYIPYADPSLFGPGELETVYIPKSPSTLKADLRNIVSLSKNYPPMRILDRQQKVLTHSILARLPVAAPVLKNGATPGTVLKGSKLLREAYEQALKFPLQEVRASSLAMPPVSIAQTMPRIFQTAEGVFAVEPASIEKFLSYIESSVANKNTTVTLQENVIRLSASVDKLQKRGIDLVRLGQKMTPNVERMIAYHYPPVAVGKAEFSVVKKLGLAGGLMAFLIYAYSSADEEKMAQRLKLNPAMLASLSVQDLVVVDRSLRLKTFALGYAQTIHQLAALAPEEIQGVLEEARMEQKVQQQARSAQTVGALKAALSR